jgi:mediator of RNA polymerase II transcription subunit 22
MSRPQQYDVFRPGALPSASLGRRPPPPSGPGALLEEKVDSASELDKVYDGWNVRIDKEVQAMAGGLRELVALADVSLLCCGGVGGSVCCA